MKGGVCARVREGSEGAERHELENVCPKSLDGKNKVTFVSFLRFLARLSPPACSPVSPSFPAAAVLPSLPSAALRSAAAADDDGGADADAEGRQESTRVACSAEGRSDAG